MLVMARILMFAVAVCFGALFISGVRKGTRPFWAFPIARRDTPELFYLWGSVIALVAVGVAWAALFAPNPR